MTKKLRILKHTVLCNGHYPGCFKMCQWYYKDKLSNCYYLFYPEETALEIRLAREKAGLK